jgi:predicted RNA binding protein YcfA (HicA-like mRNA interferase family)
VSPRLPRDLSGREMAKALRALGYEVTRQSGSHMRLTTQKGSEHHVTIPAHSPLRVGTLAAILDAVAAHHETTRNELLHRLFG